MLKFKIMVMVHLLVFILFLSAEDNPESILSASASKSISLTARKQIDPLVRSDVLRFIQGKEGKIINLNYGDTVLEDKGTPHEKVCICKANAYRAAQIVSNIWEDGIFRTGDIFEIRSGWNTEGIFELFEAVMGFPKDKIIITGRNGGQATNGKDLSLIDLWYEFIFTSGEKILLEANLTHPLSGGGFLDLRRRFKNGDDTVKKTLASERKTIVVKMAELPFKGFSSKN